jgi:hypothetical protein
MIFLKNVLSATAIAALISAGALVTATAPAAARVICNAEQDCWHSDAAAPRVPGVQFNLHPDDWYFHQTWEGSDRHYRDYHGGRGYYKSGIWITL